MKKIGVFSLTLFVVLGLAMVSNAWAKDSLKIGLLGPMTGPSSDIGEPLMRGAKLAIEEINAKGGVDCGSTKKQIELVIVDDEASPAKSVSGAQRLINKERVAVILGPANSGCALAVRRVTNPAKVLLMTPAINDTIVGPDFPFVFRSSCNYSDQVASLFKLLGDKYSKFALLHDTTGVGEGGASSFKKALAKMGKKVSTEEKYEVNTLNLMPQITRIKNAGADFICWSGVGADAITIGKVMKQIGFNIPVGGNNGLGMRVTLKAADKLEGWWFPDTVDGDKPQFKEFLEKYKKKYNDTPTYHPAAQGYDAIYAIVKGLEKTGGKGGKELVQAFWDGISILGATCGTGTAMNWNKDRVVGIDSSQLRLWQIKNGDYAMVHF